MQGLRILHRLSTTVLLSTVLATGVLFSGCGQAAQTDKKPNAAANSSTKAPSVNVTPVKPAEQKPAPKAESPAAAGTTAPASKPAAAPAETPKTSAAAAPAAKASKPDQEADFVRLDRVQKEYLKNGPKSETTDKDFASKWADLTSVMVPKNLIAGLDVLAVDTKVTGPKEYTFSFLLRSTTNLATDYHFAVVGLLEQSDLQLANPGKKYISWPLLLYNDPMSQWKAGEYHVVQLKAPVEHLVPLDLVLAVEERNAEKVSVGSKGTPARLGWQSACMNDWARLYSQQKEYEESGAKSEAAARAFEARWKRLTSDMVPRTMIDGIDLLAVDMRATGEKEYSFAILLRSTSEVKEDYHLAVVGGLDASHLQYANPGKKYVSWPVLLYETPTSRWKAGEYHVLRLRAPIGQTVPLNLEISLEARNAERRSIGPRGNPVKLGWQADTSQSQ